jgi:hypothetical protein
MPTIENALLPDSSEEAQSLMEFFGIYVVFWIFFAFFLVNFQNPYLGVNFFEFCLPPSLSPIKDSGLGPQNNLRQFAVLQKV